MKPLIFRSGSMSPEITTGSLALARTVPAGDLAIGDIVSIDNAQGTRITHRVYAIQPQDGAAAVVTLKGDANADPDVEPYSITEADRVFWSAGGLGYVAAWLSSSTAIFLGGALVGALLVIVARPSSRLDTADHPESTDLDDETPHGGRTQTP
ncbi:signal peptidase I [Prescottella agglutinans]|uniref:signal peptidase I n=1 Tax=Prescottella agglutinans TaxID=1644129 RepID=UPI003BAC8880